MEDLVYDEQSQREYLHFQEMQDRYVNEVILSGNTHPAHQEYINGFNLYGQAEPKPEDE